MSEALDRAQPWRAEAACWGMDLRIFFPPLGGTTARARSVCARCPVRRECLDYAISLDLEGGWGGTITGERRRLARRSA